MMNLISWYGLPRPLSTEHIGEEAWQKVCQTTSSHSCCFRIGSVKPVHNHNRSTRFVNVNVWVRFVHARLGTPLSKMKFGPNCCLLTSWLCTFYISRSTLS